MHIRDAPQGAHNLTLFTVNISILQYFNVANKILRGVNIVFTFVTFETFYSTSYPSSVEIQWFSCLKAILFEM